MRTTFRMDVKHFKAALLPQVQPGIGTVDLHLETTYREEEEMAAGAAAEEIHSLLQRPVVLHFADEGYVQWRPDEG